MDDIDEMFSNLLGEIDLLTQSLGVETVPPEVSSSSQNDLSNFSVGFTHFNASLNELEDQDLDALMADLAADLNVTEENLATEKRLPSPPKPDLASLPPLPPPQDCTSGSTPGHHNTTSTPILEPSLTVSPTRAPPPQPSKQLPQQETEAQNKDDKIKLALEKLKQAKVKKMVIKVLLNDGSSKTLMVDENQAVRDVLDNLFEKTHCDRGVNWSLCETNPELQTERGCEDHEFLVDILSAWTRDSENKILFLEKEDKYAIFKNPQNYYLWKKDKKFLKAMKEKEKETLLAENFSRGSIIVPDLEGTLYLKEDGKRSWKQKYFLLRASGIYYVPKGKTKTSSDLACFIQFENVNVYYATSSDYKNKHKVPTEYCFILKHPQIQKDSQYIKHLCCDDEWTMNLWVTGIRIAKYGERLYENYKTAVRKASVNSAWTNRSVPTTSTPSPSLQAKAANGGPPKASQLTKPPSAAYPETKDYGGGQAELSFPPPPRATDRIPSPTAPHLSFPLPPPPPSPPASASPALPTQPLPATPPPPAPEDFPPPPPDFFPESPPEFLPPPPPIHRPNLGPVLPPKPPPPGTPASSAQTRKKMPPAPPKRTTPVATALTSGNMMSELALAMQTRQSTIQP